MASQYKVKKFQFKNIEPLILRIVLLIVARFSY